MGSVFCAIGAPRPSQARLRSLLIAHEIPRRGQGLYPLRRRRQRLRRVPAREVHRARRPERRQRRPRRRRRGRGGGRPQHPDRLPLRSSTSRRGPACNGMGKDRHGAGGDDVVLKVPVGTQIFDEDKETLIADLTKLGQRVVLAEGGNGGFGNAHFKSLDQPRAAQRQSRPAGRGALDLAAAQADRRRRPGRPAERRQVDLPRRGERGQAEDRRLSVHHAQPAARRGRERRPRVRAGRHSRPDRRRARGHRASATASSATSSAAACCCIWSTAPASTPARTTRPCAPSSKPTARASPTSPRSSR